MCGGVCTISSQILSGPAPLSHHITTHPKGTLAEVAGTAEICGSVVKKSRTLWNRPARKVGGIGGWGGRKDLNVGANKE